MLARSLGAAAVELIEWKEILLARTLRVDTSLQEKPVYAIQDSAHTVVLPYCVEAVCHSSPPLSRYQGAPTRLNAMLNVRVSQQSEVTGSVKY